tara:strand:+ start:298 stop:573 length:276 start_codon:yes stop_codon:yes gene_type:complete
VKGVMVHIGMTETTADFQMMVLIVPMVVMITLDCVLIYATPTKHLPVMNINVNVKHLEEKTLEMVMVEVKLALQVMGVSAIQILNDVILTT